MDGARRWFQTIEGRRYERLAIAQYACPWVPETDQTRMICSAFVVRMARDGPSYPLFARDADADLIPPRAISWSPRLTTIASQARV
jgi:hypothetical protein